MKSRPELPLVHAYDILEKNLNEIDRVTEWSELCNYRDSKKFSRHFRNQFGVRPINVIKKLKLKVAIGLLSKGEMSNFEIAREIGKRDEQALYHFFIQQTGNPPKFYKRNK